ncbi:hypothetical protein [Vampirovibrio sp.]|uniref:hypothetical protein n=1 Tax=Vampirovibrio sp. TaxID=2717857 RepID=UPI0035944C1A
MSSLPTQPNSFQPRSEAFKPVGRVAFAGKSSDSAANRETPLPFDPLHKQKAGDSFKHAAAPSKSDPQSRPTTPETGKSGLFGDKVRLTTGFILEDVVPPLLGFAFVTGPLGWLVTLGSLPLSYASGKLGRRIASGVQPHNLPPAMKSFQDFREGFRNRENLKGQYDLLNKWNVFIDDALNVRAGYPKMLGGLVGRYLKVSKDSRIGQVLSSKQFLKANVYHDVAQANTMGGAFKAGAKGGMGFWFYNAFLPGAGLTLEKAADMMWGPFKAPFKGLGWILKNLALLRLGKDMLSPPRPANKPFF